MSDRRTPDRLFEEFAEYRIEPEVNWDLSRTLNFTTTGPENTLNVSRLIGDLNWTVNMATRPAQPKMDNMNEPNEQEDVIGAHGEGANDVQDTETTQAEATDTGQQHTHEHSSRDRHKSTPSSTKSNQEFFGSGCGIRLPNNECLPKTGINLIAPLQSLDLHE